MKMYACSTATHTSNNNNTINNDTPIATFIKLIKLMEEPDMDINTNLKVKNSIQSSNI